MDYSQFTAVRPELSLIAVMVVLLLFDLFAAGRLRSAFHPLACIAVLVHITTTCIPPSAAVEAFGGMYRSSPLTGIVKTLLACGALMTFLIASSWLNNDDTEHKRGEFYVLTISTLIGMNFMLSAGNFLMFVLGVELASTPMACLVAFDKYKRFSAEAGAKYILTSMFASGLMMYGVSFFYGASGTLYFNDMTAALSGSPLQIMALVFFFSGLGFKISLVPFHLWTADVYEGAPIGITAYLSVVSKGAAAVSLFIIFAKVFAPLLPYWQLIIYIVTVASITVANLFAIRQQNIKRFFAFSSISQAGYIVLGVIGGNSVSLAALVYYLLVYLAANMAAFGVISAIENKSGNSSIAEYNGLYSTNPKLTLIMTLALFSLAGIPPFAGFFSKFVIFRAAFGAGFKFLVLIALINTVISLYYYLLIVKAMYINPNDKPVGYFKSDLFARINFALCLAGIILIGFFSCIYSFINSTTGAMP